MKGAQIITIAEIKGGTGKTSTAAALAQAARLDGKKVLIVDLDGQGTITRRFGADPTMPGAYNLFATKTPIWETIQKTAQGVDIIAGAPDLYALALDKVNLFALEAAFEPAIKKYDLIVIDTPPQLCPVTYAALQASNGLLITLFADMGSAEGLKITLEHAQEIRRTNKKLKVLGCLITQFDARPIISKRLRDLIKEVAAANKCKYLGEIRRGVSIQEAAAYGKNLFEYAPKSKPAIDYMNIYKQVIL